MKTFRFLSVSGRLPSRRQLAKAIRRRWLQITAPRWARIVWRKREIGLKQSKKRGVRVCDMNDGHLLNTIAFLQRERDLPLRWYEHDYAPFVPDDMQPRPILNVMVREASRRGFKCTADAIMTTGRLPKWLEEENAAFGARERARIAAKLIKVAA